MRLYIIPLVVAGLVGCARNQAPDVAGTIRNSIHNAGLNTVSVTQDRVKGVLTLSGNVTRQTDKDRAAQIARSLSQGQVVADEIAVLPPGYEATARAVNADLDKGIEGNLDAALTQYGMKTVRHSTTNGVITLKGEVETPERRAEAERLAANVPNVQQVVNEIDVKNQRATTSGAADRSR